jgi:hypothetical protein
VFLQKETGSTFPALQQKKNQTKWINLASENQVCLSGYHNLQVYVQKCISKTSLSTAMLLAYLRTHGNHLVQSFPEKGSIYTRL